MPRSDPQRLASRLLADAVALVDHGMGAGYAEKHPCVVGHALVALALLEVARQVDGCGAALSDMNLRD